MADTPEQAHLREHLAELRRVAGSVGRDIALHAADIDRKIDKLGRSAGKDAKYLAWELDDDLAALGKSLSKDLRALPGAIAGGATTAGAAIRDGAAEFATRTSDAVHTAARSAAEGTRNALASAAGVRRKPMREWHSPGADAGSDDRN